MARSAAILARLLPATEPEQPDDRLLRMFVSTRDQDAFAEIVRRHGPMVLATCLRVLSDPNDAEDAFQAAFLVLARKASQVRATKLAGWLYAVAVRTARGVRVMRNRRRKHSLRSQETGVRSQMDQSSNSLAPDSDLLVIEQAAIIDEELAKLPDHYREALVLCELRGLSREQAAAELGVPEGTLSSRLAGAKRKLAARLSIRGLSAPALAAILAPAAVSAALAQAAVGVSRGAAGPVASAAASAVMKAMLFDQLKAVALAAGILLTAVCGGLAMTGVPGGSDPAPAPREAQGPAAKLVGQLGAPEFADREEAAKKLRELGAKAEPALRIALKSEDPEVRNRAAKILVAIRADAREAFVKTFDPAGTADYDHPVWKRFKMIVGSDAPARKLFAEIIADPRSFRLLDDAERDPERAGGLYADEVGRIHAAVQKILASLRTGDVGPDALPWPGLPAVLYLGTYPSSTGKVKDGWASERDVFAPDHYQRWVKSPTAPALKRVFAAWLARRDHPETREHGFAIALFHQVEEVLPSARTAAAGEKNPAKLRLAALAVVAQFGTRADRPLFEALFADETPVATSIEMRTGYGSFGSLITTQARDAAAGMALLLYGEDPYAYGFWQASGRFHKIGDRPSLNNYELRHFGFHDVFDIPRANSAKTHEKVKAFLDKQPKLQKEEPKPDPAVMKLVEQLGAPEFADREAAQKALRELGTKAQPALRAGLKSENAEVVKRCREVLDQLVRAEFDAKHWPRFAKVVGDDTASRELFERVRSLRRNAELLDAIAADPDSAGKLYHDRWAELNKAARTPTGPGGYLLTAAPLADVAGWMYLGTFSGAEGSHHQSSSLDFLPMSFHRNSRDALPVALKDKVASVALRRLIGKWTETRTDYSGRAFGFQLALAYDITEVLPAARATLGAEVKDDPYPGNTARNVGLAMLVVGKLGSKDDLRLLERYAGDETRCAVVLNDPPPKPGVPPIRLLRHPVEGQDATAQLRDVSAAMRLHLFGQDPDGFGFYWHAARDRTDGKRDVKIDDPFDLYAIGFLRASDRTTAHKAAKEWLDKQPKTEPKKDKPE